MAITYIPDEPKKVYGSNCLQYINKPIGFSWFGHVNWLQNISWDRENGRYTNIHGLQNYAEIQNTTPYNHLTICQWLHDTSKVKVGIMRKRYRDGGIEIDIIGNDTINGTTNFKIFDRTIHYQAVQKYKIKSATDIDYEMDGNIPDSPTYSNTLPNTTNSTVFCKTFQETYNVSFEDFQNFIVNNLSLATGLTTLGDNWRYNGSIPQNRSTYPLSMTPSNSLRFGVGEERFIDVYGLFLNDPLATLQGDLYSAFSELNWYVKAALPSEFPANYDFSQFVGTIQNTHEITDHNCTSIPYNLIIFQNLNDANNYINNGVVSDDAFLYPLDWENLPTYNPSGENSDDDDDGGNPDDDAKPSRDIEPTPLVVPALLPTMFNANNMYWLGIGEFSNFLTWFWYDIQQFSLVNPSTWDNLFDNIQGLYSNLASAIISVRYYPIKEKWVGGLGNQEVIKVGQVQKDGLVNTLSKYEKPKIWKIGSYKVDRNFDSFLDLPPYSELTLFLPYYGYVDLDMDMFNGHSVDVKATYDVLSGTITYYIFYDDTFMVNMYTAKMSVDIPITLQTAYDRDRTIQDNVATTLSGFMSAGAGALTGNPVGMVMGISSLNSTVSPQNTAPIKVEGMSVEQGSLYQPSRCAIIVRRPVTTDKGDSFAKNVGNLWCKTARLGNSDLIRGLTICANPRIHFNGVEYYDEQDRPTGKMILPLESEIEEIYDYLSKGVII